MKKCPHCGAEIDEDETVCPECGEEIEDYTDDEIFFLIHEIMNK